MRRKGEDRRRIVLTLDEAKKRSLKTGAAANGKTVSDFVWGLYVEWLKTGGVISEGNKNNG